MLFEVFPADKRLTNSEEIPNFAAETKQVKRV